MKLRALKVFVFVLVLCSASAKRYSGSSRGSSRGGIFSGWGRSKPSSSVHRPSNLPTSFNRPGKSSSDFLHSESGRPSRPAPSHNSGQTYKPSAPSHDKPAVRDHHQQSHASSSHADPYGRQPAHNPYVPSGGYSGLPAAPHGVSVPNYGHNSAPYPSHLPNHPHPSNIGSSSHPSIQPQHYPSSYNVPPAPHGIGGGYHPAPYHPPTSYQPTYHQPAYQSPPATAPFVPGRTVYVTESRRGGSGIGSAIATGLAGGAAAGVASAATSAAINSIFRPSYNNVHTYPSAPAVGTPTTTVTHTTNNYYYGQPGDSAGNGAAPAAPGAPVNQPPVSSVQSSPTNQANPSGPSSNYPSSTSNGVASRDQGSQPASPAASAPVISDENIMKLTEELFSKQDVNLNDLVELNLQNRVKGTTESTVPDEAPQPLFKVKPELDSIPTVSALKALYDNYQRDGSVKENMTPERRSEENAFLDEIVRTPVMRTALDWLADQKFVEKDTYEQKDLLRRMWFNTFDDTSSGFERIFLSEKFGDGGIVGMQNWIYFADLESKNNVDYLGYVDTLNLSGKGLLVKLNYKTEGFTMQNATIFAGTAPELELSLYTICFYARPNNWCPISLGGAKFFILTHSFRSFGKDLIDLGFPAF